MKAPKFERESDLCAAFLAWLSWQHPDVTAYAEWAGWDILLVYPEGWQIGIQAKLRLNAAVMLQAAPDRWFEGTHGPDFRAVLVPEANGYSEIARRLGLIVFWPRKTPTYIKRHYEERTEFQPLLRDQHGEDVDSPGRSDFVDWNPTERHELPPVATDAVAGSPCPVSLTPWKLGALAVLAELELKGTITTKRIREIGVDPRRWTQSHWLLPTETRGLWTLGGDCPRFDRQHPTAYAAAMEKAGELQR